MLCRDFAMKILHSKIWKEKLEVTWPNWWHGHYLLTPSTFLQNLLRRNLPHGPISLGAKFHPSATNAVVAIHRCHLPTYVHLYITDCTNNALGKVQRALIIPFVYQTLWPFMLVAMDDLYILPHILSNPAHSHMDIAALCSLFTYSVGISHFQVAHWHEHLSGSNINDRLSI